MIDICLTKDDGDRKYSLLENSLTEIFFSERNEIRIRKGHSLIESPRSVLVEALSEYAKFCIYIANDYKPELLDLRDGGIRDIWDYSDFFDLPEFSQEKKKILTLEFLEQKANYWDLEAHINGDILQIFPTDEMKEKMILFDEKSNNIGEVIIQALDFLQNLRENTENKYKLRYTDPKGEVYFH